MASLEAAVGFTNAIAGAMPTLTQLLASSSVIDVQVAGNGHCTVLQHVSRSLLDLAAPLGGCQPSGSGCSGDVKSSVLSAICGCHGLQPCSSSCWHC